MRKKKEAAPVRANNEIRGILLTYFYDRNRNATSDKGKKGSAVRISDVKSELKASHALSQSEVQSNLTYLISMGWVEADTITKSFETNRGVKIPSETNYYRITAQGIDKIEGEGEYTMDKFHGIKIEATGQNIITVGDGNQINAAFGDLGEGLAELKEAVTASDIPEEQKLSYVADIDTIQNQLAKPEPNRTIVKAAWESVKGIATINSCVTLFQRVGELIGPFLT